MPGVWRLGLWHLLFAIAANWSRLCTVLYAAVEPVRRSLFLASGLVVSTPLPPPREWLLFIGLCGVAGDTSIASRGGEGCLGFGGWGFGIYFLPSPQTSLGCVPFFTLQSNLPDVASCGVGPVRRSFRRNCTPFFSYGKKNSSPSETSAPKRRNKSNPPTCAYNKSTLSRSAP